MRSNAISNDEIMESREYWRRIPAFNEGKTLLQIKGFLIKLNESIESADKGISFAKKFISLSENLSDDHLEYAFEFISGNVDKLGKKGSSRFNCLGEVEVIISQTIAALEDREMTARLLVGIFERLNSYLLNLNKMEAGLFQLLAWMFELTARFCECLANTDCLESIKKLLHTNLSIQNRAFLKKWPYGMAVRVFCYEELQPDLWNLFCYICNVPSIVKSINNCVFDRKRFEETCSYLRYHAKADNEVKSDNKTCIIVNIAKFCERYNSISKDNQILDPQWVPPQLNVINLDDTLYAVSLLYSSSIFEEVESQDDYEEINRHIIKCATRLMLPSISVQIATYHSSNYRLSTHNDPSYIVIYTETLCDVSASLFRCTKYLNLGLDLSLRDKLLSLGCSLWNYGFNSVKELENILPLTLDEIKQCGTPINKTLFLISDTMGNYFNYLNVGSALFVERAECLLAHAAKGFSDTSLSSCLKDAIEHFQISYDCLQEMFRILENKSTNEANISDYLEDSDKLRLLIALEHVKLAQFQCQAVEELYGDHKKFVCSDTANKIVKICNRLNRYNSIASRYIEGPFGTLDRLVKDICIFFKNEHDLDNEDSIATIVVNIALICRLIRIELKVELRNHMNEEKIRILNDLSSMNDEWWVNVPEDIACVCKDIVSDARDLLNQDCEHEKSSEADRLLYYTSIKNACYLFDEMIYNNKCGHLTVHNDDSNSQEITDTDVQTINCLTVMNAKYMNDPNEGRALLGYLFSGGSTFGESEEMFREEVLSDGLDFIRSFTTLYDTLNMWSLYGSTTEGEKSCDGCCIEIDPLTFTEALSNSCDTSFESINSLGVKDIDICLPWQSVEDESNIYNILYLNRTDNGYEASFAFQNISRDKFNRIKRLLMRLNSQVSTLSRKAKNRNSRVELDRGKRFVASQVSPILYLFKDADYYQEEEKRLVIFRDTDEQSLKSIRVLPASEPNAPRLLCINPRYQVYVKSITLGPNVGRADEWVPDLMYRLGKMKAKALKNGIRDYDPKVYFSKIPFR